MTEVQSIYIASVNPGARTMPSPDGSVKWPRTVSPQSSASLLTVAQLRAVPAAWAEVGPPAQQHNVSGHSSVMPAADLADILMSV